MTKLSKILLVSPLVMGQDTGEWRFTKILWNQCLANKTINGWEIMDETECWGNDLEAVYDFETIEGCIAFCDGVHDSDALTFSPSETGCYCKNRGCANARPRPIEDAGSKIVSARKFAGQNKVFKPEFNSILSFSPWSENWCCDQRLERNEWSWLLGEWNCPVPWLWNCWAMYWLLELVDKLFFP